MQPEADSSTTELPGLECPACATSNPAYAHFCYECGAHLAWAAAERRIITILFADVSGFTSLTEQLDAEQVHSLITVWLDPLCEAVIRWGGHVDKFIGDCVMALFGAPVAYENEPERAVRAALDMQSAFNEAAIVDAATAAGIRGYRPRLSIGINTGGVVTGMFSSGGAWDYTAIGDAVNVAARLQGVCEPGGILVGETTWQQTRHVVEFGEQRILKVKGRSEPVSARAVTGLREVRVTVRGFSNLETPLIGRGTDLERLRERWHRAVAGEPEVCLLVGAAGIGKSRLVAELAAAEGLSRTAIAGGRSYPYARSTPWEPIAELIRDLYRVGSECSAAEAVTAIVERAPETWSEYDRAALGAVLGSPVSDLRRLEDLAPEERHERIIGTVVQVLEQGVQQPTLLVLEDLHWADRTTIEFLRSVTAIGLHGPFLLVLISRPPLQSEPQLAELINTFEKRFELAPLSRQETSDLVDAILGDHEIPDELLRMIHARSGGNPLFIEEIIKALTDSGIIDRRGNVWWAVQDHRRFGIPDTIESVISTRIDGLEPSAKKVLQYASIVGHRFWSDVLGEALAERSVERELTDLVDAALVRPQSDPATGADTEYAFEHLLLQEVTYSELLASVRAELHGAVAAWFETHQAGESVECADRIAYHFERSKQPARALPYLERAISGAWERGAVLDAEGLIARALAVAATPDDRVRINRVAEDIATAVGHDERRLAAIDRLAAIAGAEGNRGTAADATYRRARRLLDIGELEESRELARSALDLFRGLGDRSAEADSLTLLGRIAHLWGSYDEALDYYRAALPLERESGDRRGEAEILCSLGLAEVDFGHFTRALDYFEQARAIYVEISHRSGQALALAYRATAFRWLGRYDEAEETARAAEEAATDCASRSALATARLARAIAIGAAGRGDEAKRQLRDLAGVLPQLRRPELEARLWLALGELESGLEAREAVKRARRVAATGGFMHVEVLGLTRLAELALEADELISADTYSRSAIELLEQHGDIQGPDEVVYYIRSRVLAALGRRDEAEKARHRAREIIRQTADRIDNAALRRSFLENVAPNPAIMASETI